VRKATVTMGLKETIMDNALRAVEKPYLIALIVLTVFVNLAMLDSSGMK